MFYLFYNLIGGGWWLVMEDLERIVLETHVKKCFSKDSATVIIEDVPGRFGTNRIFDKPPL